MEKKEFDVIGMGALNVDYTYKVDEIIGDDEIDIKDYQKFGGGSATNTIYGLAKLGANCGFVGAIGDDEDGNFILGDIQSVKINTESIAIKKGIKTGLTIILIDKIGRRAIYVLPGANREISKKDLSLNYFNRSKIIHFSSFAEDKQLQLQKWIIKNVSPEVKISFAPGALYIKKGLKNIQSILERCEILLINQSEIETLMGRDYPKAVDRILKLGCKIILVTLAGAGCFIATKEKKIKVPVMKTKVIDTTGAGDAFAAGFLYGYLNQYNLEKSAIMGNILASCCVEKMGARTNCPTEKRLLSLYNKIIKS